mmetsp:Transcript_13614/g.24519  ORF Transcript_13614/g.24519 Transcript_13614/m.24519 type:complete len:377 (+) Transcript_13614:169-1299(+)
MKAPLRPPPMEHQSSGPLSFRPFGSIVPDDSPNKESLYQLNSSQLISVTELNLNFIRVAVGLSLGDHRRVQFTTHDLVEEGGAGVSLLEVLCILHILPAVDARAETPLGLSAKEALQQGLAMDVLEAPGEHQRVLQHSRANLCWVIQLVCERQVATDKLEEHDAHGPQVHLRAIAMTSHDLRSHVVGGADHGEGSALSFLKPLGNSEVDELQVALLVEHHVLRLEVAVDDVAVRKLLKDDNEGACVKLRLCACKHRRNLSDRPVQFATGDKLGEDVHGFCGLEGLHKGHDEGMICGLEKGALAHHLLRDFSALLHDALQRIPHLCLLVLHQADDSCGALTDDLDLLHVFEPKIGVLQPDAVHQLLLHVALHDLAEG